MTIGEFLNPLVPHREALDDGFLDEEGKDRNRKDDQGGGSADAGPVDLSVGDEVVDRDRHRLRLRSGEDEREEEMVCGRDALEEGDHQPDHHRHGDDLVGEEDRFQVLDHCRFRHRHGIASSKTRLVSRRMYLDPSMCP